MRLLCRAAIGVSLPAIPPRSRSSPPPFPQIHSFRLPSRHHSIRPRPQPRRSFPPLSMATQEPMNLLFVEMGVGYDQHGQDITAAAMRACKDAISSNSIPAFRRGSIPGVNSDQMKLRIKLGVPRSAQSSLDVERVKSVFP